MKSILIIGNRLSCYNVVANNPRYRIVKIYALKESLLDKYLNDNQINHICFSIDEKENVIDALLKENYNILISNGCPFILPAGKLKSQGKILINTHPTYLPFLRGATPLNGVFYLGYDFIGATTHYISDGIDSGNIIYQEKIDVTPDLDQGLIYFISFDLESIVFSKALELLEYNNFKYTGSKMELSKGSYFNRTKEMQYIDFSKDSLELCIKKLKSFSISSQGCFCNIMGHKYQLFSGEIINNTYLVNKFSNSTIGTIVLKYDDSLIIKAKDGLIKISKYKLIE